MQRDYHVRTLTVQDVPRAYVIVQHLFGLASFEEWRMATLGDVQRQRWIAVVDKVGVVRGLCYGELVSESGSLTLDIPVFSAISLFDEDRIARQLIDAAKTRAVASGCSSIHIWRAGKQAWSEILTGKPVKTRLSGITYDLRASGDVPS